jgi:hypothetical protein
MAINKTKSKVKVPKGRPSKSYARPQWIKALRVIGLTVAYIVIF